MLTLLIDNGIYKQVSDAEDILFGNNACNFTTAKNSNNTVAKAMVAASKQIARELSKGKVVNPAFEEKAYVALEATIFENLSKVFPKK
ncbi:MAG: hypothetical protein AB8V11_03990 [Francisella endosymbiont of Hyalomma asiaticum]